MKRLVALILALILVAVAAGCGGAKSGGAGGSGSGTMKIGVIAPMTGDVKTFGDSTKNGATLAWEQAGKKAGNINLELIVGDDRNDPTEGVNVANKFITQDGVKAIVGSVSSKVSIPISEVANASKIVMITGTSTNTKVTVDDKGNVKPYIFRACFIDPFQGAVGAKFALNNLKVKSAAILYDKGNDYTVGLSEEFKKNFEKGGGKVVAMETYGKDDTDFSAVLTKVAAAKPDFLYLPDYYNKVSLIAKQAKGKGLNVPMMGGDGWDSGDLDYATLDGQYFTNHYSEQDTRPEVKNFVEAYKKKYDVVPDALAALAYDATTLLIEAIKKADSTDPAKIQKAMAGLKDVTTVSGKVSFDKNNNPVKSAAILKVKANKTYEFVTTVAP
ncbi:MAG TPA: ABC transporter substrate-binding protein [Symbiobacteriaceae bacterium]|nr:ABC transporter substrate-binding protein [Symbiobacteriaceae bacterium]